MILAVDGYKTPVGASIEGKTNLPDILDLHQNGA